MAVKNDANVRKELTSCFKIDMRYLANFDPDT